MSGPRRTPTASPPWRRSDPMTERAVPFHCPYCGEEDLRPHAAAGGSWECRSCLRAFSLTMLGLLRPDGTGSASDPSDPEEAR